MFDYEDTSDWQKINGTTIGYELDGKNHTKKLEKEPQTLHARLSRLSVIDRTKWELAEDKNDEQAGYSSGEYISAMGLLDRARIQCFSPDEEENETFDKIDRSIYPTGIEDLQKTSKISDFLFSGDPDERPEGGWLENELGQIWYSASEYYNDVSSVNATLRLDEKTFGDLVQKIKVGGTLISARL